MSAVKSLFFEELQRSLAPARSPAFPSLPSAAAPALRHVFILTMNGQPLSVYAHETTALRDLTLMREGDERDGYDNVYFIKEMRIDYTTPTPQP